MDALHHPKSLRGKRYIAYARCAAAEGSAQSLRRQIRLIRQLGDRLKMCCVEEVRIAGVNGRAPLLRSDLSELLARKCNRDDFDALVMEDYARLTRSGVARLEALFALSGVQIVYVATWDAAGTVVPHRTAQCRGTRMRNNSDRAGQLPCQSQTARSR